MADMSNLELRLQTLTPTRKLVDFIRQLARGCGKRSRKEWLVSRIGSRVIYDPPRILPHSTSLSKIPRRGKSFNANPCLGV